jgi:hypothetical protein
MLWDVSMVNAMSMYLSNYTLRKLGIMVFPPEFCVGCHVGCLVGCLIGLDDRAKEDGEGVSNDEDQAQHMTHHKKLLNTPYYMNMSE